MYLILFNWLASLNVCIQPVAGDQESVEENVIQFTFEILENYPLSFGKPFH